MINFFPDTPLQCPNIAVIGVGGAGSNAINNMIRSKLEAVDFIAIDTDAIALQQCLAPIKIQLDEKITRGLGSGSRPDIAFKAAEESTDRIVDALKGYQIVFITAGMGGGTGTGATPVVVRAAQEIGALTIGVVSKPFHFEGAHRMRTAEACIDRLTKLIDALIVIPNQNLFRSAKERTTFADAFKMADDVLYWGVRCVVDLLAMPGLINLDIGDVRTVMSKTGAAMIGMGEAEGAGRATWAAEAAIRNPLLNAASVKGARGVLLNIVGGLDMTLFEVDEAANRIRDELDTDADIIFGSTFDENLVGKMRVCLIATGIGSTSAPTKEASTISLIEAQRTPRATSGPSSVAESIATPPASTYREPTPEFGSELKDKALSLSKIVPQRVGGLFDLLRRPKSLAENETNGATTFARHPEKFAIVETLNARQCRAARSVLNWSQDDLALKSKMSKKTIADFERGAREPYPTTVGEIYATFLAHSILFIEDGIAAHIKEVVELLDQKEPDEDGGILLSPAQCRASRALLGLSQEELALTSGVGKKTIADYENYARCPHRRALSALAGALIRSGATIASNERMIAVVARTTGAQTADIEIPAFLRRQAH